MKSVLIAGYYGEENLGDEAILAATLGVLKGQLPDHNLLLAATITETLHGVKAITWRSMSRIAWAVSQAQLVIIGGGGIFQDYWGLNPNPTCDPITVVLPPMAAWLSWQIDLVFPACCLVWASDR